MTLPEDIKQPEVEDVLSEIFGLPKILKERGSNVTGEVFENLKENLEFGIEKGKEVAKDIKEKGGEIISEAKEFIEDKWSFMQRLYWILMAFLILSALLVITYLFWKFRTLFSLMWKGIMIGRTVIKFFFGGKEGRRERKEIKVNAIELEELNPKPSAPTLNDLEEKAYILDYIPSVCSVKSRKRCYVEVLFGGKIQKALIDCGADISYCGESVASRCGLKINSKDVPMAWAANSTPITFLGSSMVTIEIGGSTMRWPFLVSEDKSCPGGLVIGTDLMEEKEEIKLNFKNKTIQLGEDILPMIAAMEYVELPKRQIEVRLLENYVLPPLSDSLLWGTVNRIFDPTQQFLLEEWSQHEYWPVKIGRTLSQPGSSRLIPLRILNFGNSHVQIYGKSRVGILEPIYADEKGANSVEVFMRKDEYISPEVNWEDELPQLPNLELKSERISDKLNLEGTALSKQGIVSLKNMVDEKSEAFVKSDGIIGLYKGNIVHQIELEPGTRPVQQRPYTIPHALREEVEKQIKEMIKQNIIKPSSSAWASPIVLVKKADGKSWRFAVDYRALNKCTKKQTYLLPRIQDLLDVVGGKSLFSIFDLQSGFHQVKMNKKHTDRTAFITHCGLYEFLRLPFGLAGAPHTFQKVMEEMRQQLSRSFLVYLDDVILGSETENQHLNDLNAFLNVLCEVGMKLRAEKCRWGCSEIRYLGFLISERGVRLDDSDLKPILKIKRPENLAELRSLIGMFSYFRRFIRGFAGIMAPIYELTKKESTRDWNEKHDKILEEMKNRLTSAPILATPKFGRPFILETDASGIAIGACLLQENNKKEVHPIAFYSRTLNKHEKNYSVVELEALALVSALKQFRVYLEGAGTSTVITDNSALTSLFRRKDLQGRLARYQIVLQAFDVNIIYRPGKFNKVGDHLSRYPPEADIEIKSIEIEKKISIDELSKAQKCDHEILLKRQENEENIKEINGIIWGKIKDDWKILIPQAIKNKIINEFHEDPLQGAHLGINRTLEKIKRSMHWKGLAKDVADRIRICEVCQKRKVVGVHLSREEICPIEPASRPFDRVHLDLLGPIQKSFRGHQYIFVAVDSFSKWAIAVPIRNQTATTISEIFLKEIICRFGIPSLVVTDQGTQFMSSTFTDLAQAMNFCHKPTTAYHQSANGMVERFNRTLADMIATCTEQGKQWVDVLPQAIFAYNTSYNQQINNSPFYVIHGFAPKLPTEAALGIEKEKFNDMNLYVKNLVENLELVRSEVKCRLQGNMDIMRKQQIKINKKNWEKGEKVLVKKMENIKKFGDKYEGPFIIVELLHPNLLISDSGLADEAWLVHMDRCKPFYSEEIVNKKDKRVVGDTNLEQSDSDEEDRIQINAIINNLECINTNKTNASTHNSCLDENTKKFTNSNATKETNLNINFQIRKDLIKSKIIIILKMPNSNSTSSSIIFEQQNRLPWHFEDVSSPELSEDDERIMPYSKEDKEKEKAKKIAKNIEDNKSRNAGVKRKKEEQEIANSVDWDMAYRLKRIRSKYEDDMLTKHNDIWEEILKKGDQFHAKIQDKLHKERKALEKERKEKKKGRKNEKKQTRKEAETEANQKKSKENYGKEVKMRSEAKIEKKKLDDEKKKPREAEIKNKVDTKPKEKKTGVSDFIKFASRVVQRAVVDKTDDVVPEELPEDKKKIIKEKEEEEKLIKLGKYQEKMKSRRNNFDEEFVARGFKTREYSMSPVRRPVVGYIDEKDKKDKMEKIKAKENKKVEITTKEIGVNTVFNTLVFNRILENLEEVQDFLTLKPTAK
uniref:RNA-directed DNA polymerase n=1 Tax=Meloidogyne enterolobii TaxID=390850 RepID=A0A6V7XHH9_MELEN|nr:unnamed protein product [Meloidogyne enterolobii]